MRLNCPICRVNWPKTAEFIADLANKNFENQSGRKFLKYIPIGYGLFSPEAQRIDETSTQRDKDIAKEASENREKEKHNELASQVGEQLIE